MLVKPCQRWGDPGILVAQPVDELDGERVGQSCSVALCEHNRRWLSRASANTQKAVREIIRLPPCRVAVHDQLGEPPEILDQHDPQRYGDCPQLADC